MYRIQKIIQKVRAFCFYYKFLVKKMNKQAVLVIDDEKITRTLIELTLKHAGYKIGVAESANEGLAMFKNEHFDIVITDILMPDKMGLDLIPDLLDIKKVPIIAISGGRRKTFNSDFILDAAKDCGATVTLKKPVSPNILLATINKLFA